MARPSFDDCLRRIETDGYAEVTDAFPAPLLARVNELIEAPLDVPTVNGRRGYVQSGSTRFLYQTLTWGREILDVYTDPWLIDLADRHSGEAVHLSNYRIYRSFPSALDRMPWHVDNKIDTFDPVTGKFRVEMAAHDRGLILIMYLSDVVDGGLQIVAGSHQWAYDRETWDDKESEFADKIVTFNERPAGTAILYDYRCIHRAKPYRGGKIRTSLFAQYSPARMPAGEPVLLNARDIADLSDHQRRVLNFGRAPTTENWPIGDPGELAPQIGLYPVLRRYVRVRVKSMPNRVLANR